MKLSWVAGAMRGQRTANVVESLRVTLTELQNIERIQHSLYK